LKMLATFKNTANVFSNFSFTCKQNRIENECYHRGCHGSGNSHAFLILHSEHCVPVNNTVRTSRSTEKYRGNVKAYSYPQISETKAQPNEHASFIRDSDILTHSFILRRSLNPINIRLYPCK